MISLLGGRMAYRLVWYAIGLFLLAHWGSTDFAYFATATGAASWLFALVSSGPEKAALVLIPLPGGGHNEGRILTITLAWGAAAGLVGAAVTISAPAPDSWVRFVLAGCYWTVLGAVTIFATLLRLRGRFLGDSLAFLAVSLGLVIGCVTAVVADLDPYQTLALLTAIVSLVAIAQLALLLRVGARPASPLPDSELWRAIGTLGVGELLSTLSGSILFAYFAIVGDAHQTSLFYVLMVLSSAFAVGFLFMLRLIQPRLVQRIADGTGPDGRRVTRRVSGVVLAAGAPALVAAAAVVVLVSSGPLVAGVLLLGEMTLFAVLSICLLLLESSDGSGRAWSASTSAIEFVVVVALALPLITWRGAAGALLALWAALLVKAGLLRFATSPRHRQHTVPATGPGTMSAPPVQES